MPSYKLSYFDANARAEVARLILAVSGVEYEDHRFKFEDWPSIKPNTPFGQVPVLYIDGTPLCESGAINRYLATEYGLNGSNALQAAYIEMIGGVLGDVYTKIPYFEKDPVVKAEKTTKVMVEMVMPTLAKMEKKFNERKADFLIGDKLSYADLAMTNCLMHTEVHNPKYLEAVPGLNRLKERVRNMQGIKQYYAAHPPEGY